MSWLNTLLPASFRGVGAEVKSVKDTGENALVEHNYPYRNGGDLENFGRDAHKVPVEFVLWGDNYESKLKALVTAFEALDAGELVHPIFGSMKCHAKNWEVVHTADEYNYCTVSVTFWEDGSDVPFFNRSLPNALGGLAGLQSLAALDALLNQYESYMDMAMAYLGAGSSALSQLRGCWDRLMNPLFELKNGVTRLGGDVFSFPRGAFSDVLSLFNALHGSDKGKFIIAPPSTDAQTIAGTGVVVRPTASCHVHTMSLLFQSSNTVIFEDF
jgi:prophage DNA circulation protein